MTDFFKYKRVNFAKLAAFGFQKRGDAWRYTAPVLEGEFDLTVCIAEDGAVTTQLIEREFGEPYTLHLVEEAAGEFVGRVREAVGAVLRDVATRCFDKSVFREAQTQALIAHVREKYGAEPEYLWDRFPDCAIWRRADNEKWFGIVLTVQRKKLGLVGEEIVESLDVRRDPEELKMMIDGKRYFPGWHMNKKHWITVPLDDTLPMDEIFSLVEESYFLAKK